MARFDPYLPRDRRHALAGNVPLPEKTEGAVLFADIAGFTPLTASLARDLGAQRGAEELNRLLTEVYTVLISCTHAFRGSVIHFGGDSITCWFDDWPVAGAPDLPDGAGRAVAAAFAMQTAMAPFGTIQTLTGSTVSVGLKVAITAGDVRRFLVGQEEVQLIEVLAGRLLDRMAAAEAAARQGEIVVGAEVLGRFGPALVVEAWRGERGGQAGRSDFFAVVRRNAEVPGAWPPAAPWPETALPIAAGSERWVLAVIRRRIRESEDAFLAELRRTTSVFLSFGGLDYDQDPEAGKKLNDYITWVQTVFSRFEGHLLQVTIGDKGSYLLGVFGAPIAHEDDPLRAVSAARALLVPAERLEFITHTRIGISQGITYVGNYGSPNRLTLGAQGNETNIAARLMQQAAPGQIVVSAQVADATRHAFALESLDAVTLKGVAQPLPVFAVGGRRRRHIGDQLKGRALAPIIGRNAEKQRLMTALDGLRDGQNQTVVVEGDAGIGKSRLVVAYLEEVERAGMRTLVGAGSSIERSTAYFAWRPIVREVLEIEERDGVQAARRRAAARLGGDESLAPLLNAVLPLRLAESELTKQLAGEARANSTRELVVRLLADVCGHEPGFVLVFEDAQWLDSASWALIGLARQRIVPLMTLIVARPGVAAQEYMQLLREPGVQQLELEALTAEETTTLVSHRLGVETLPAAVTTFIQEQAEGHPFFSEEIAYALRDAGLLRIQGGRSYLASNVTNLRDLDFPATVQGVITSRIDRIDADQQLTLKVASVIGRLFPYRTLEYIYPAPESRARLPVHLEKLTELDLILPEMPEPDKAYLFKHSITQEVVYTLMTYSQRQQLHRQAAEWYERRHGDELQAHYGLLAHHWSRADEPKKALHYLDRAGRQALRNFANAEAIRFFTDALALDEASKAALQDSVGGAGRDRAARRAEWELLLGEAYVHWTRYLEGREHLERGLRLLGRPVPGRGVLLRMTGAMVRQLVHRSWPRDLATSDRDEREALLTASRAYARLVEVYYHFGELLASVHATFHSLNLAERAGDSAELAEAYAPIGAFFSFLRRHGVAQAYFERALETAQLVNSLSALAYVLLVKATYDSSRGAWAAADESINQLVSIGQKLGARRRYNDGLQLRAIRQYLSGDFEACLQTAAALLVAAREVDDLRFQGWAYYAQVHAYYRLGELETALARLADLEALYASGAGLTDEQLDFNMNGIAGRLQMRRGDVNRALAAAEKAFQLSQGSLQTSYYTLSGYSGGASVFLAHWEAAPGDRERRKKADQSLRALRRFAATFAVGRPSALVYQGDFQRIDGNVAGALRHWQAALTAATELEMPFQAGRAHLRLGRHASAPEGEARRHLLAARELFERVGARRELAMVDEYLADQTGRYDEQS